MTPARVLAAAGLALVLLASASVALAAGRVALVVGNDAADMASALRRLGFDVTTAQDADRASLNEALRELPGAGRRSARAGHRRAVRDGGVGRRAGGEYPSSAQSFTLAASEPVGVNSVILLVTRQPLSGFSGNDTLTRPVSLALRTDEFVPRLNGATAALPRASWSADEIQVRIVG